MTTFVTGYNVGDLVKVVSSKETKKFLPQHSFIETMMGKEYKIETVEQWGEQGTFIRLGGVMISAADVILAKTEAATHVGGVTCAAIHCGKMNTVKSRWCQEHLSAEITRAKMMKVTAEVIAGLVDAYVDDAGVIKAFVAQEDKDINYVDDMQSLRGYLKSWVTFQRDLVENDLTEDVKRLEAMK